MARRCLSNSFSCDSLSGRRGADDDGHVVFSAAPIGFFHERETGGFW